MKRKSDELYARAMKHGNSEATVIEHMSSLIVYCEATTEYRGDDARMWAIERYNDELDAEELVECTKYKETKSTHTANCT